MSEDTPNNIINFPISRAMRVRHAFNKTKNLLEEKGMKYLGIDDYDDAGPEPVKDALDAHINKAITEGRTASMQTGIEEGKDAKILSMRDHQIKKNMAAGDASVDRLINMDDPTKD